MDSTSGDAPKPAAPKPRKVAWWRRVPSLRRLILFSLLVFGGAVATLVGGFSYIQNIVPIQATTGVYNPITTIFEPAQASQIVFQGKERLNILVLGIDYNYDRKGILYTKGARSDSMMVVSLSPKAEFLNIISIPRDCQVLISEKYGTEKINAAYSFGGPKQAMETVSQFLGVPIDHYLVVKVYGAIKVFDALGGVPIDVEKNMDYDDNWGHLHVHLKKGPQVLTGEQAVGYARFRHDEESDRGRMRRQQQTIRALVDKLKDPSLVMRIPELARAVKQTLETDLTVVEMGQLAHLYAGFDHKKIRSAQIVGDDTMINGVSMIIPYGPENEKTVRRLLKDDNNLGVKEVKIRVLNGSRDSGAAERLADKLNLEGFQVVSVDKADNDAYNATVIQEHTKSPRVHGVLNGLIQGAEFKSVAAPKDAGYDITIIVGNDQNLVTQSWPEQPPASNDSHSSYNPPAYQPPAYQPPAPDLHLDLPPDPALQVHPQTPAPAPPAPAHAQEPAPREVPREVPVHEPPAAPPSHKPQPATQDVLVPQVPAPARPDTAPAPPATPIPPAAAPPSDSGSLPVQPKA